jgi:hypothetical protein
MKFVGITRFNVVTQRTLGSFRVTRDKTLEEAQAMIYQDDRMEARFALLSAFCLPTYKMLNSQEASSRGLILISRSMPERHKNRVHRMCQDIPGVNIVEMEDDHRVGDISLKEATKIAEGERLFTYRYDDDDALPRDYLSRISRLASDAVDGTVISLNIGYNLGRFSETNFRIRERDYPMNAFGLGLVSSAGKYQTIFQKGNHVTISDTPIIHDRSPASFLAAVHGGNDSRIGEMRVSNMTADQVLEVLADRFPQISREALQLLPIREEKYSQ